MKFSKAVKIVPEPPTSSRKTGSRVALLQERPNRTPNEIKVIREENAKYRAIPSIPSKQRNYGFEEIGEGFLALKQEAPMEFLGPGHYDVV
jgi:hypothetical protein